MPIAKGRAVGAVVPLLPAEAVSPMRTRREQPLGRQQYRMDSAAVPNIKECAPKENPPYRKGTGGGGKTCPRIGNRCRKEASAVVRSDR